LPIGLGLNFTVNGRDYAVPMAIEEPSVVAAVSGSALLVRAHGGFEAEADAGHMIGQVQLLGLTDVAAAERELTAFTGTILALANAAAPSLARRGGGAIALTLRRFPEEPSMLVAHLIIDCVDAMGANAVNTMVEAVAPALGELSGGRPLLRILSNLADERLAR